MQGLFNIAHANIERPPGRGEPRPNEQDNKGRNAKRAQVLVLDTGRGRHGSIYHKDGHFVHKPKDGYVDRILFRDSSEETLQPGDRVLIILRTNLWRSLE